MAAPEASSPPPKTISLETAEFVVFELETDIAKEMEALQSFIEEAGAATSSTAIFLPNVFSHDMKMIIEYLKHHRLGEGKKFDAEFVKPLSDDELKKFVNAVYNLKVKGLRDLLCDAVVDRIHNKSVEFVRRFFGVENDFTPEEEAKILKETSWAFDGFDEDEEF